jgi:citrate synthase
MFHEVLSEVMFPGNPLGLLAMTGAVFVVAAVIALLVGVLLAQSITDPLTRAAGLMKRIGAEAERVSGRSLPINATGAIGPICCELGFSDKIVRGFGVMARAVGLVGHLLEESESPMALEIWQRVEDEASAHARPAEG